VKAIKQSYLIHASVDAVWQALIDPKIINDWGGGPVEMDDNEGTEFFLWGGDIFGKNIEVLPGKKLVQEWFGGKWDKPSIITFTLKKVKDATRVDLAQIDVPDNAAKDIANGWEDYYMGPLKDFVENVT
jgi:activator of HSP90 ATPase